MSAPVDVLAALNDAVPAYGSKFPYADIDRTRDAVADALAALADARAYLMRCAPASDRPASEWGRVMDRAGAALARCKGAQA